MTTHRADTMHYPRPATQACGKEISENGPPRPEQARARGHQQQQQQHAHPPPARVFPSVATEMASPVAERTWGPHPGGAAPHVVATAALSPDPATKAGTEATESE